MSVSSTDRETFLERNLSDFLQTHLSSVSLSDMDEIGRSYILSVLDELGSEDAADELSDVDQFTEIMDAYLPGFGQLASVTVSEWMFELSSKLNNMDNPDNLTAQPLTNGSAVSGSPEQTSLTTPLQLPEWPNPYKDTPPPGISNHASPNLTNGHDNPFKDIFSKQLSLPEPTLSCDVTDVRTRTQSVSCEDQNEAGRVRTVSLPPVLMQKDERRRRTQSSSSTASSDVSSSLNGDTQIGDAGSEEEPDEAVELLVEMFPNACAMEISHCLSVANGNTEQAAQLILSRQECGQNITRSAAKKKGRAPGSKNASGNFLDDAKVKKSIINKYAYVDVDCDKKQYKPVMPRTQNKKMVRYLDSKIVSTRGDRFTEIQKDEDEKMKKTFVNLKPAKQYRFH